MTAAGSAGAPAETLDDRAGRLARDLGDVAHRLGAGGARSASRPRRSLPKSSLSAALRLASVSAAADRARPGRAPGRWRAPRPASSHARRRRRRPSAASRWRRRGRGRCAPCGPRSPCRSGAARASTGTSRASRTRWRTRATAPETCSRRTAGSWTGLRPRGRLPFALFRAGPSQDLQRQHGGKARLARLPAGRPLGGSASDGEQQQE